MRVVPILCAGLLVQAATGQALGQAGAPDAESALREGTRAQEHGDLKTAIADFRKALSLKPDLVEAHANLGAALAASGQLNAAIEEDVLALDAAPQNEAVRMNLAMAYYRAGDWNHARIEFERLHAVHPEGLNTAVLLAYAYNKLSREADAAALLAPFAPGHEGDFQFEYVYAYALIASGKQDDGLPRMEKLAKEKNSAEAWLVAGSTRFYRGEMKIAREDLDAAVALNPKLPGLQTMAGQARYAMRDMPAAASAFQEALRADPVDFVANRDLGAMRLKEGDTGNARPLLELALQLQPRDPLTRLEVAKLDDQTGKYAEAAAILEDLVKSDPNWLDPHWVLAQVYSEMNRPEEGRRERGIAHEIELKQKAATEKKN
jgi:tetratricopeptide (TPR) repeat protein